MSARQGLELELSPTAASRPGISIDSNAAVAVRDRRDVIHALGRIVVIAAAPGGPGPMTAIDGTADLATSYLSAMAERPLVNGSN